MKALACSLWDTAKAFYSFMFCIFAARAADEALCIERCTDGGSVKRRVFLSHDKVVRKTKVCPSIQMDRIATERMLLNGRMSFRLVNDFFDLCRELFGDLACLGAVPCADGEIYLELGLGARGAHGERRTARQQEFQHV